MNKTRGLLFTAGIVLATAFTLSCGLLDDGKEEGGGGSSSSDDGDNSSSSGGGGSSSSDDGSVTIGGKKYNIVKIGEQVWMAENLNYEAEGSKCYNDSLANCEAYGRLYDWETAMDVCPAGWHLPSQADWDTLIMAVGDNAGTKLKAMLGWNEDGNGTDEFGFSALPGGLGDSQGFDGVGYGGIWWTANEYESNRNGAYLRGMLSDKEDVPWDKGDKSALLSVRCVQGERQNLSSSSDGGSVTIGGKKYNTVDIGEQTWMAENLNYAGSDNSKGKCYDNLPPYCEAYGRLYTWSEANEVCPSGWHLPSNEEWTTLTDFVGDNAGTKLKANSGWIENGNGTDEFGFSAKPGGIHSVGEFDGAGDSGGWWSAFEENSYFAFSRWMGYDYEDVNFGSSSKSDLLSVRCVKD